MAARCRAGLLPALLLILVSGCATASKTGGDAGAIPDDSQGTSAEAPSTRPAAGTRALLLGTQDIQLGPGISKNAYRWMGDGQWGF
jgi:hypothetical protein